MIVWFGILVECFNSQLTGQKEELAAMPERQLVKLGVRLKNKMLLQNRSFNHGWQWNQLLHEDAKQMRQSRFPHWVSITCVVITEVSC